MRISITPKEKQGVGQFNGGQILENKPIGFPQDGGNQRSYSNLFYWAHAWSDEGSLLGEHPHKGFEIVHTNAYWKFETLECEDPVNFTDLGGDRPQGLPKSGGPCS